MSEQLQRHPFCDFALTRSDVVEGIEIADVGVGILPLFWETGVAYVEDDADWFLATDGHTSTMAPMGIIPYGSGAWSMTVSFLNTAENRRIMFDRLLVEKKLIAAESAIMMAQAHPHEFERRLSEAENLVRQLRPADYVELVIRPI